MASVAGLEVGLPSSIEEVDASWMTKVLRTSGTLGDGDSVTSVKLEPFAVGVGFLSLLHRATLQYDSAPDDAPATVIVKMVSDLENSRNIAEALHFYARELRFYRELAPKAGFRTPKGHAAMLSEDGSEFVVVMEDMSGFRQLDQSAGVSGDDALLAVETVARLHRNFMGTDLSHLEDTFFPLDNPIHRVALPQTFDSGWPTCKTEAGHLLNDELIAFGDRYSEGLASLLERLSMNRTFLHGDWRADNLLVDDDAGELIGIDFQISGTGVPTYDLGYFMSQSMEPAVRADYSDRIIARYFESLGAEGAEFDRDELYDGMRLAIAFCLIYPVSQFANWAGLPEALQTMALSMLERSVSSIMDYNALELFAD